MASGANAFVSSPQASLVWMTAVPVVTIRAAAVAAELAMNRRLSSLMVSTCSLIVASSFGVVSPVICRVVVFLLAVLSAVTAVLLQHFDPVPVGIGHEEKLR